MGGCSLGRQVQEEGDGAEAIGPAGQHLREGVLAQGDAREPNGDRRNAEEGSGQRGQRKEEGDTGHGGGGMEADVPPSVEQDDAYSR